MPAHGAASVHKLLPHPHGTQVGAYLCGKTVQLDRAQSQCTAPMLKSFLQICRMHRVDRVDFGSAGCTASIASMCLHDTPECSSSCIRLAVRCRFACPTEPNSVMRSGASSLVAVACGGDTPAVLHDAMHYVAAPTWPPWVQNTMDMRGCSATVPSPTHACSSLCTGSMLHRNCEQPPWLHRHRAQSQCTAPMLKSFLRICRMHRVDGPSAG